MAFGGYGVSRVSIQEPPGSTINAESLQWLITFCVNSEHQRQLYVLFPNTKVTLS
jgi:hypothetical protein